MEAGFSKFSRFGESRVVLLLQVKYIKESGMLNVSSIMLLQSYLVIRCFCILSLLECCKFEQFSVLTVFCFAQVNELICVEKFEDFPQLGRFTLRDEGTALWLQVLFTVARQ